MVEDSHTSAELRREVLRKIAEIKRKQNRRRRKRRRRQPPAPILE